MLNITYRYGQTEIEIWHEMHYCPQHLLGLKHYYLYIGQTTNTAQYYRPKTNIIRLQSYINNETEQPINSSTIIFLQYVPWLPIKYIPDLTIFTGDTKIDTELHSTVYDLSYNSIK